MRTERKRSRLGQSTVELALLLPIVAGLLYLTIQGFSVNHSASEQSIRLHADTLKAFEHGNGVIRLPDGVERRPGEFGEIIPAVPPINIGEILGNQLVGAVKDLGLNALFSNVGFLSGDSWYVGALKGGLRAGLDSFVSSGFKTIEWESVGWGAASGALASKDATEFFQGDDWAKGGSARELLGSGVQGGLLGYTRSEGDPTAALAGVVGGALNSDTSKAWFENGEADIVKGALRGAIQGSVSGLAKGEFDLKNVAISTVMGAVNTKTVASWVPGSGWGGGDPRKSATFGATTAALSTLLNGGNLGDVALSATSGALFSSQSMGALTGGNDMLGAGIGAVYGWGVSMIQGESGDKALISAVQSGFQGYASAKLQSMAGGLVGNAANPSEMQRNLDGSGEGSPSYENAVEGITTSADGAAEIVPDVLGNAKALAGDGHINRVKNLNAPEGDEEVPGEPK